MDSTSRPGVFYGYIVVAAAFAVMFVTWGTQYTFGIFFNPLLDEFGWNRATTSGAYSISFILHGALSIVAGKLTDRFGPRPVVTLSGLMLGLGYLLMSQINATWQLYLFYSLLVGIGMSSSSVPQMTTVARWFVKRRGMMTGIAIAGAGIGVTVMPLLMKWFITAYGWREAYLLTGGLVLLLMVGGAQFLSRDPRQKGVLPYGVDRVNEAEVMAGLRGLPVSDALRSRQFWLLFGLFLCFGFALDMIIVHVVPHIIELGFSASSAGILSTIGAMSVVGRITMGLVVDRIGSRSSLLLSFVILSAALFWLLVSGEVWMLFLFAGAFGFAYGGLIALTSTAVAELFGLGSHGAIVGMVVLGETAGESLGPLVAGRIFDVAGNYYPAFLISGVAGIVGFLLALMLRPLSKKEDVLPATKPVIR
ncbi:MAG: MFS transporter [Chloroflexi bacterium]|nr:MFS transporter [Chloroflexota bacterium]